jgi:hypothetical protein
MGIPSNIWIHLALSPAGFLTALAGKLVGTTNTLLLFRISVALEGMILLSGVYALCRAFLHTFAAQAFVLLTMWNCLHWSTQIWWNFRLYYMVPWVLYFIHRFFADRRGNPLDLMMAGLLTIIGLMGSLPYFGPFHAAIILLFLPVCAKLYPGATAKIRAQWRLSLIGGLAVALLTLCYFVSGWRSLAILEPFAGHDADTLGVSSTDFLIYARNAPFWEVLRAVNVGWPIISPWLRYPDQTLYIGVLPLFLFVWACFRVRERAFLAWLVPTVFVIWFSMAGIFAFLFFFVPGFSLLRHLGLLLSAAKVLVVIAAGFGLEDFLSNPKPGRFLILAGTVALLADSVFDEDLALAFLRWFVGMPLEKWQVIFFRRSILYTAGAMAIPGVLFLASRVPKLRGLSGPIAALSLAGMFAYDLTSHHSLVSRFYPKVSGEDAATFARLTQARPVKYAERLKDLPTDPDYQQLKRYLDRIEIPGLRSGINQSVLMMFHMDGCNTAARTVFRTASVAALSEAAPNPENPWLHAVLNCEVPKAFLMPADLMVESKTPGGSGAPAETSAELGSVRVAGFTANEVRFDTNVNSASGAYLVYSDAFSADWSASVDGNKTSLLPALSAFKAVRLSAGSHTVRLAIERPWILDPTWIAEALGAAVLGWLAVLQGVRAIKAHQYKISD